MPLCGHLRFASLQVSKLSNNRKDARKQLLGLMDAVLVFLKSHGALINQVKPEMLLEYDDFCGWVAGWLGGLGTVSGLEQASGA